MLNQMETDLIKCYTPVYNVKSNESAHYKKPAIFRLVDEIDLNIKTQIIRADG